MGKRNCRIKSTQEKTFFGEILFGTMLSHFNVPLADIYLQNFPRQDVSWCFEFAEGKSTNLWRDTKKASLTSRRIFSILYVRLRTKVGSTHPDLAQKKKNIKMRPPSTFPFLGNSRLKKMVFFIFGQGGFARKEEKKKKIKTFARLYFWHLWFFRVEQEWRIALGWSFGQIKSRDICETKEGLLSYGRASFLGAFSFFCLGNERRIFF